MSLKSKERLDLEERAVMAGMRRIVARVKPDEVLSDYCERSDAAKAKVWTGTHHPLVEDGLYEIEQNSSKRWTAGSPRLRTDRSEVTINSSISSKGRKVESLVAPERLKVGTDYVISVKPGAELVYGKGGELHGVTVYGPNEHSEPSKLFALDAVYWDSVNGKTVTVERNLCKPKDMARKNPAASLLKPADWQAKQDREKNNGKAQKPAEMPEILFKSKLPLETRTAYSVAGGAITYDKLEAEKYYAQNASKRKDAAEVLAAEKKAKEVNEAAEKLRQAAREKAARHRATTIRLRAAGMNPEDISLLLARLDKEEAEMIAEGALDGIRIARQLSIVENNALSKLASNKEVKVEKSEKEKQAERVAKLAADPRRKAQEKKEFLAKRNAYLAEQHRQEEAKKKETIRTRLTEEEYIAKALAYTQRKIDRMNAAAAEKRALAARSKQTVVVTSALDRAVETAVTPTVAFTLNVEPQRPFLNELSPVLTAEDKKVKPCIVAAFGDVKAISDRQLQYCLDVSEVALRNQNVRLKEVQQEDDVLTIFRCEEAVTNLQKDVDLFMKEVQSRLANK